MDIPSFCVNELLHHHPGIEISVKKAQITQGGLTGSARELLATPDDTGVAGLVTMLLAERRIRGAGNEAFKLYDFCTEKYPNCLCLKLFRVFRDSRFNREVRDHSIRLLLVLFQEGRGRLSLETLPDLKSLAISSLEEETSDYVVTMLSQVVSIIAGEVFMSQDFEWDELRDYIASAVKSDYKKAFLVVRDLPVIMQDKFLLPVVESVFEEILTRLEPERVEDEDWPLVFTTAFAMGVRLAESERADLAKNVLYAMLKSTVHMVGKEKEFYVRRGVYGMGFLLGDDALEYEECQDAFMLEVLRKLATVVGIGQATKGFLGRATERITTRAESRRQMRQRKVFPGDDILVEAI